METPKLLPWLAAAAVTVVGIPVAVVVFTAEAGRAPQAAAASPAPPSTPVGSPSSRPTPAADLSDPRKKNLAMQLVSSAENSSLDWKAQYRYIEDIGDGRGYYARRKPTGCAPWASSSTTTRSSCTARARTR